VVYDLVGNREDVFEFFVERSEKIIEYVFPLERERESYVLHSISRRFFVCVSTSFYIFYLYSLRISRRFFVFFVFFFTSFFFLTMSPA
jgi:hypothetical protein